MDQLVDWRMEKKQHMRWTQRGAQMLLHARCALLNGPQWRSRTFRSWMASQRLQVLTAIRTNFVIGQAFMAEEFFSNNAKETHSDANGHEAIPITREPHAEFKKKVPSAIGLIRTGDAAPYANIILVSA